MADYQLEHLTSTGHVPNIYYAPETLGGGQ